MFGQTRPPSRAHALPGPPSRPRVAGNPSHKSAPDTASTTADTRLSRLVRTLLVLSRTPSRKLRSGGDRLGLERPMHALMTPVLLRVSGVDSLQLNPEPDPPHAEPRKPRQARRGERRTGYRKGSSWAGRTPGKSLSRVRVSISVRNSPYRKSSADRSVCPAGFNASIAQLGWAPWLFARKHRGG